MCERTQSTFLLKKGRKVGAPGVFFEQKNFFWGHMKYSLQKLWHMEQKNVFWGTWDFFFFFLGAPGGEIVQEARKLSNFHQQH